MKNIGYTFLGLLQVFVGMGALAGGIPMLLNPKGSAQGLNPDMLANSPFTDFLIPAIILVSIHGLGSLIGANATMNRKKYSGLLGAFLGTALIIWIIVQYYFIRTTNWLQPTFFIIGIVEVGLGFYLHRLDKTSAK